jgi:hypothetical protein
MLSWGSIALVESDMMLFDVIELSSIDNTMAAMSGAIDAANNIITGLVARSVAFDTSTVRS